MNQHKKDDFEIYDDYKNDGEANYKHRSLGKGGYSSSRSDHFKYDKIRGGMKIEDRHAQHRVRTTLRSKVSKSNLEGQEDIPEGHDAKGRSFPNNRRRISVKSCLYKTERKYYHSKKQQIYSLHSYSRIYEDPEDCGCNIKGLIV